MMSRTCLVTGGAGFIGSHLVGGLLETGWQVRVLDNLSSGSESNLEAITRAGTAKPELIRGDLRDGSTVRTAIAGVEVVYHEAAFVSVPASMDDPGLCFDVNCTGTATLLEAARTAGVRRVVLASSAAVYGDTSELPLQESCVARPLSPYAASKLVDEVYAALYTQALDLEVVALRYFNVYGPRQRPDTQYAAAVPIFVSRLREGKPPTIFGDGGQTRDLVFVGDVVRANLISADHPDAPGQIFNVCTGSKTSINELVETLYELIPGAPAPKHAGARQGDIYESVGDPGKAGNLIGFVARTTLRHGLEKTVAWAQ